MRAPFLEQLAVAVEGRVEEPGNRTCEPVPGRQSQGELVRVQSGFRRSVTHAQVLGQVRQVLALRDGALLVALTLQGGAELGSAVPCRCPTV